MWHMARRLEQEAEVSEDDDDDGDKEEELGEGDQSLFLQLPTNK